MRLALLVLALVWAGFAAAPARAADPTYRYCRADEGAFSLVRTVTDGGKFAFQSLEGSAGIRTPRIKLAAYLSWVSSPDAEPDLILVHGRWDLENSEAGGSRAVLVGADGKTSAEFETIDQFETETHRIGARALLDRFAGQQQVKLLLYAAGKNIPRHSLSLNLDAVRAMLMAGARLAPRLAAATCATNSGGLPDYLDAAAVISCTFRTHDAYGDFAFTNFNNGVSWSYAASRTISIAAGAAPEKDESPDAFLARAERPFRPVATLGLVILGEDRLVNRTDLAFALQGAGGRMEVARIWNQSVDWSAILALERAGPLTLEIHDAAGRMVKRLPLPAGLFAAAEARLAERVPTWRIMRTMPMRYCSPEAPIVVT